MSKVFKLWDNTECTAEQINYAIEFVRSNREMYIAITDKVFEMICKNPSNNQLAWYNYYMNEYLNNVDAYIDVDHITDEWFNNYSFSAMQLTLYIKGFEDEETMTSLTVDATREYILEQMAM